MRLKREHVPKKLWAWNGQASSSIFKGLTDQLSVAKASTSNAACPTPTASASDHYACQTEPAAAECLATCKAKTSVHGAR